MYSKLNFFLHLLTTCSIFSKMSGKIRMTLSARNIYIVYIILELMCTCSCQCSNEITNFEQYGNSNSSLGVGHAFKVLSTSDIVSCMEFCCRFSLCRSVDLNRGQKRCQLNVRSAVEEPGLLVTSNSTHHVDKVDFPKIVSNDCFNNNCESSSMYVASSGCVPILGKTCGRPPDVPNTNMTTPQGPFSVGHTHHYSACAEGYVPFWAPYTTCQENGEWSDVVYQCIDRCIASGNSRIGSWCYYFSDVEGKLQTAKDLCSARGMNMPRIETSVEWDALKVTLVRSYWIDGYAQYTFWPFREFYWEAGYKIGYRPWAPIQPDNLLLNQFNIRISSKGWDDENSGSKFYAMCEIDY